MFTLIRVRVQDICLRCLGPSSSLHVAISSDTDVRVRPRLCNAHAQSRLFTRSLLQITKMAIYGLGWPQIQASDVVYSERPEGLDSDRWIPLRGGARFRIRERDSHNTLSAVFTYLNLAQRGFSHQSHTRWLDEQKQCHNNPICASTDDVLSIGSTEKRCLQIGRVCDIMKIPQSRMATATSRPAVWDIRDTVNLPRGSDQSAMLNSNWVWDYKLSYFISMI